MTDDVDAIPIPEEQIFEEPRAPAGDAGLLMARRALAAARAEARRRGREASDSGLRQVAGATGRSSVQSLRRGEEVRSGAGPDERDPQLLRGAVPRLLAAHGWEGRAAAGDTLANWGAVVGAELADHCVPKGLANGTLIVRAESTSWATQLRLLAPVILGRVNEHLATVAGAAAEQVRQLRVRGPDAPSWQKGRLSVKGRGPRDTYG